MLICANDIFAVGEIRLRVEDETKGGYCQVGEGTESNGDHTYFWGPSMIDDDVVLRKENNNLVLRRYSHGLFTSQNMANSLQLVKTCEAI